MNPNRRHLVSGVTPLIAAATYNRREVVRLLLQAGATGDVVSFDGAYITVHDLKRLIAEKKGLDKEGQAELLLTNASDGRDYDEDENALVWKNASVIVRRVPKAIGKTIGDDDALKEEKS